MSVECYKVVKKHFPQTVKEVLPLCSNYALRCTLFLKLCAFRAKFVLRIYDSRNLLLRQPSFLSYAV